jgi:hypothetical protein
MTETGNMGRRLAGLGWGIVLLTGLLAALPAQAPAGALAGQAWFQAATGPAYQVLV